ncbi:helix-turn-helix domain-containing protein [Lentzea guizhouensis]|uniref:helix-turn-helix domain-containing protein n=1 Tax=Lentzea guizhouensis TaxID=1586287 RepID=UPI003AAB08FD
MTPREPASTCGPRSPGHPPGRSRGGRGEGPARPGRWPHAEAGAGPADALSGRERRVAERAAAGASNREIAEELFVTVRTVESHLSNVYRKLGVELRTDLPAALTTSLRTTRA